MVRQLASLGYDDAGLDRVGAVVGFADVVTPEQLAAAGVAPGVVFTIRRRLDPAVRQGNLTRACC